jgi:anti-sigma factor RsiW
LPLAAAAGVSEPFRRFLGHKEMKCSDLQFNLPLYPADLSAVELSATEQHLSACPVCRERASDLQMIRQRLRNISAPDIPDSLERRMLQLVQDELGNHQRTASVIIGLTVLTSLFSGGLIQPQQPRHDARDLLVASGSVDSEGDAVITPIEFAHARFGLGAESPSLNPEGALVALSKSLVGGELRDGEVVVVADVFENGLARLEQVVQPSRNRAVVHQLQRALDAETASTAPFLPAELEARPESVRVVFRFQSVNVPIGLRSRRQNL